VLARSGGREVEVVLQRRLVVGVRAVIDDLLGAALRRQAAQVGYALLGDDDLQVVLGVIDVADHRHDARALRMPRPDRPVRCRRDHFASGAGSEP
jgi:ABC-type uncharacterized transport system YnjBCD ATPase subunit